MGLYESLLSGGRPPHKNAPGGPDVGAEPAYSDDGILGSHAAGSGMSVEQWETSPPEEPPAAFGSATEAPRQRVDHTLAVPAPDDAAGGGGGNSSVMVLRFRRTRLPVLLVRTKPRLCVGSMLK